MRPIFLLYILLSASLYSSALHAQTTTEAWERREILANPVELGENIVKEVIQGRWTNDGFNGPIKYLIVDTGKGTNKLYVQWLTDDKNEVSYSVSIREFNVAPEYAIEMPKCLNDACSLTKISAVHAYEQHEQTFMLNLVGLGRYTVGI